MSPDDNHNPAQIAVLTDSLRKLAGMDLPPDARALVASALGAAMALHGPPRLAIDQTTFASLMALAGPEVGPDLLAQLAADLADVAGALPPALAADDRPGVRAQTHVLMALAGSVGARPLYDAAAALNNGAHGTGDMAADAADVLAGLAQLQRFINDERARTPPHKGPA